MYVFSRPGNGPTYFTTPRPISPRDLVTSTNIPSWISLLDLGANGLVNTFVSVEDAVTPEWYGVVARDWELVE